MTDATTPDATTPDATNNDEQWTRFYEKDANTARQNGYTDAHYAAYLAKKGPQAAVSSLSDNDATNADVDQAGITALYSQVKTQQQQQQKNKKKKK